jgi:hypothetical protein
MSEMKHTPAPWTMQTVPTSCGVCFKVGPFPWKNGKLNHACIYADYPCPLSIEYKTAVANATLIAAAPDLLAALISTVDHWSSQFEKNGHMAPEWVKKSRVAIAKATGANHE